MVLENCPRPWPRPLSFVLGLGLENLSSFNITEDSQCSTYAAARLVTRTTRRDQLFYVRRQLHVLQPTDEPAWFTSHCLTKHRRTCRITSHLGNSRSSTSDRQLTNLMFCTMHTHHFRWHKFYRCWRILVYGTVCHRTSRAISSRARLNFFGLIWPRPRPMWLFHALEIFYLNDSFAGSAVLLLLWLQIIVCVSK